MDYTEIEDVFVQSGARFYTSAYNIQAKLQNIKAYVFDWNGVFNDGRKGTDHSGTYSEIDMRGIHMLRFAHFLMHKNMAHIAILNEHDDVLAKSTAKLEQFNEVYTRVVNKEMALEHFCKKHKIEPDNVVYVFDDIMDVGVASKVGIRLAVGRNSPLFMDYLKRKKLVDFGSGNSGSHHAVREHCELLMMLYDKHHEVIDRMGADDEACRDFEERCKLTNTEVYSWRDNTFYLSL